MVTKFIYKPLTLLIVFTLILLSNPAAALAASSGSFTKESAFRFHVLKFYMDPSLVTDMDFVKAVLPKYVADMNIILAKNTNRQFVFVPEADIFLTTVKPHTDSAKKPLPNNDFEIWVHIVKSDMQVSYGGYAGVDASGAGVLAGLHWTNIYDPDQLNVTELTDYLKQLNNMLHEFAHVLGAGIGEYYSLAKVIDTTGVNPLMDINVSDLNDRYWSTKPDFMTDPLFRFTNASSREKYIDTVQYSNLTAAILNGDYRNGVPSIEQYTVQVVDENSQPVPFAEVKIWSVEANSPYTSQFLFEGTADEAGQVITTWGGNGPQHNSSNLLRLIKVYKDAIPLAQPAYISIYDADISRLVFQNDLFIVPIKTAQNQQFTNNDYEDVFLSTASHDGWTLENGETSNKGGSFNSTASSLMLGDNSANQQYRAILSFDTSNLPDHAEVQSAELKIKQSGIVGHNPFASLGNLLVEIRNGSFENSEELSVVDFQAKATASNVGVFGRKPFNNWYTAVLNLAGKQNINRTGITQFRLRFKKGDNDNLKMDSMKFFSGNNSSDKPELVIVYTLP